MLCSPPLQEERPKQNFADIYSGFCDFFEVFFFLFLILRSNSIIFLSFTFKLKTIEFPSSYLNVPMFHEGQKNVSYFFLTVDGNFCSEALTSVMENLNHSNSQRSKGKEEVAITLIKQRKHAQAIIPQEKNKQKKGFPPIC